MSAAGPGALLGAFRLLTAVPLPPGRGPEPAGAATAWFPLVGAAVGGALYLVLSLPLPPILLGALALLASAALTGGLHEDGLMDTADAVLAPGEREQRLAILGDPRVGAHGVTVGVTVLLLRFALLGLVSPVAAPVAAVVGRWTMAVSLAAVPPARAVGLGAAYRRGARPLTASALALGLLGLAALVAGPLRTGSAVALGGSTAAVFAWFAVRRLGGLNGDGHGAAGLLSETAALVAFVGP